MKKILLFAVAVMAFMTVQAQSVRFVHNGTVLENDTTITITELGVSGFSMDWYPTISNTSNKAVEVIVSVDVNQDSNKHADKMDALTMCDANNCFPANVSELPAFTLAAGEETTHHFHAQFQVMSKFQGYTDAYIEATYYIMNTADEEDYTYVNVIFDLSKASVDKTQMSSDVKLFQRGENLVCNYNFDAAANRNIVVSNIVGARVANINLDGNNGEATIGRLAKGVYVYTLVENGRNIQSRKIVVR
jgi:hypothetical protein